MSIPIELWLVRRCPDCLVPPGGNVHRSRLSPGGNVHRSRLSRTLSHDESMGGASSCTFNLQYRGTTQLRANEVAQFSLVTDAMNSASSHQAGKTKGQSGDAAQAQTRQADRSAKSTDSSKGLGNVSFRIEDGLLQELIYHPETQSSEKIEKEDMTEEQARKAYPPAPAPQAIEIRRQS